MRQKTTPRFYNAAWCVAIIVTVASVGCGAPEAVQGGGARRVVELRVSPRGASGMLGILGPQERAAAHLLNVTRKIAELREDASVAGVLLRADSGGLTRSDIQEITAAVERFRAAGKYVLAYALAPDNAGYTLACAADRIAVSPAGVLDLTGVTANVMFYKDLMDKVGIRADFVRAGEYKSAGEPYTRSDMSTEHREMVERLLDDLYAQMTQTIAKGRGVSISRAAELIDGGPYTAEEALAVGLVDDLAYADELDHLLDSLVGEDID
ncbi:MAG: S49 family peptidase, partial [Candidatus Poribacteria bacterium]